MTFQEWFNNYIQDKPFGSDAGLDHIYNSKKEVWDAAVQAQTTEQKVIDFSALSVQHSSYNNVDCYAIRDVVSILKYYGFEVIL